jgi:uncharacterized protein involved in exopolysaccharide biosynthesis
MPHGTPSPETHQARVHSKPQPPDEHTGPKAMFLRILGKVLSILLAFF